MVLRDMVNDAFSQMVMRRAGGRFFGGSAKTEERRGGRSMMVVSTQNVLGFSTAFGVAGRLNIPGEAGGVDCPGLQSNQVRR